MSVTRGDQMLAELRNDLRRCVRAWLEAREIGSADERRLLGNLVVAYFETSEPSVSFSAFVEEVTAATQALSQVAVSFPPVSAEQVREALLGLGGQLPQLSALVDELAGVERAA